MIPVAISRILNACRVLCIGVLFVSAAFLAGNSAAETITDEGKSKVTPWSGYWWPHRDGALLGPLKKYDTLTGRAAAAWEKKKHPAGPTVPKWHGYCHAWSAASVLDNEPRRGRVTRENGRRVKLDIGDLKGLLTACHSRDVCNSYGDRFGDKRGNESRDDPSPDRLWRAMRKYIKQQKVPLVMDLECGPEVWNYPIYEYRVEFEKEEVNGRRNATMTLTHADAAVPPDFLGTQQVTRTYFFSFEIDEGSIVDGSGRWEDVSKKDHPDFAWYPFIVRAENPELDYAVVQRWTNETPGEPGSTADDDSTGASSRPEESSDTNETSDGASDAGNPNEGGDRPPVPRILSPLEVVSLVTNKTSHFAFDLQISGFDGARYAVGEPYSLRAISAAEAWVYVFHVRPDGELTVVFPRSDKDDNRVTPQKPLKIGDEKAGPRAAAPVGVHTLLAVATRKRLRLGGIIADASVARRSLASSPGGKDRAETRLESKFDWNPSLRSAISEVMRKFAKGAPVSDRLVTAVPREAVGEFAQDRVFFQVAP